MAEPSPNEARFPPAPRIDDLPQKRMRASRGGPELTEITAALEVVTPILGGGNRTRALDEVEIIRPATIRGHLRFWWRALHAHEHASAKMLHAAEAELFGHAAGDAGGRSKVEIHVRVEQVGELDETDVHPARTPGAYALWPARSEREDPRRNKPAVPLAPRCKPGTRFRLTLRGPVECEAELRNVVRAWLLFGGYGSRTRRGLGSLTVYEDARAWLPGEATQPGIATCFGRDVLAPPETPPGDTPWLAGAKLHVGPTSRDAQDSWLEALDWLRDFRQGTEGDDGQRAREPGSGNRPSISNWPEADKLRHLKCKTRSHTPWHNANPAWPRAGFGLPILGRFQTEDRHRNRRGYDEPDPFELRWRSSDGKDHDRLASPLIVKALPLANGRFVPCALWLTRAHPPGEPLVKGEPRSAAPFDRLLGEGDKPRFAALEGKETLRNAFFDWLRERHGTREVAR